MTPSRKERFGWIAPLLLIAGAAILIGWSVTREEVTVMDRAGEARTLAGPELVRAAASDRLLRGPAGELVDIRVLEPGAPVRPADDDDCFT